MKAIADIIASITTAIFFKGNSLKLFEVNATTGVITNTRIVDYEEVGETLEFKIKAEDMGKPIQRHSLVNVRMTTWQ